MKKIALTALAAALAGCTNGGPAPSPQAAASAAAADSLIRHYIRSNRDGSQPEHIVHFRPSRTEVAVYKWMSKCNGAAYVTATLDPELWEPLTLDAGKVGKDGRQEKFGRIALEPNLDGGTRTVSVWADLPGGRVSDREDGIAGGVPWFLFDYDLGDLSAYLQETRPEGQFMFDWALVWPDGEDFLTRMGIFIATPRGMELRDGRRVRRHDISNSYGKIASGSLWTDPESFAIVEAELSAPNHPGMKDFRLKLERTESGGQAAWDALIKGHYADCPA